MPDSETVARFLRMKGLPASPQNMQVASAYLYSNPAAMQQTRYQQRRDVSEQGEMPPDNNGSIEQLIAETVGGTQRNAAGTKTAGTVEGYTGQGAQSPAGLTGVAEQEQPTGNAGKQKQATPSTQGQGEPVVLPPEKPTPEQVKAEPSINTIVENSADEDGSAPWSDMWGRLLGIGGGVVGAGAAIASTKGMDKMRLAREGAAPIPGVTERMPPDPTQAIPGVTSAAPLDLTEPADIPGVTEGALTSPPAPMESPEQIPGVTSGTTAPDAMNTLDAAKGQTMQMVQRAFTAAGVPMTMTPNGMIRLETPNGVVTFPPKRLADPTFMYQLYHSLGQVRANAISKSFGELVPTMIRQVF